LDKADFCAIERLTGCFVTFTGFISLGKREARFCTYPLNFDRSICFVVFVSTL